MKVWISKDGKQGTITYAAKSKRVVVKFPVESDKLNIERYLSTSQVFRIPESQQIDDYREDHAFPTENETYFRLTLNTLKVNTGVHVKHKKPKNN